MGYNLLLAFKSFLLRNYNDQNEYDCRHHIELEIAFIILGLLNTILLKRSCNHMWFLLCYGNMHKIIGSL